MNEDIKKELREISPLLASLEKKNPFLVPPGYFETLSENILPSNMASEVPEGYFDSLPTQVLSKAKKETKVFSIRRIAAIAAVFIAGLLGVWSLMGDNNVVVNEAYATDIDSEIDEAFDFMLLNGEYEIADLLDLVDDESIEELIFNTENDLIEDLYLDDIIDELDSYQLEELL